MNRNVITPYFWNCLGSALFVSSIGVAVSVARTETLELELARYKLKTGAALVKVQQQTEAAPIPEVSKRKIDRVIDEAEEEVERKLDGDEASN